MYFFQRKLEIIGKIQLFLFALLGQALDPFMLPAFSVTCARVLKLYIPDYTSTIFCPGMMKGFAYYGNIIKNLFGALLAWLISNYKKKKKK